MAVRVALAPQTEDKATSAKRIDGSLVFNPAKEDCLEYTPSVTGNTHTMTFSLWIKRTEALTQRYLWSAFNGSNTDRIGIVADDQLIVELKDGNSTEAEWHTDYKLNDINTWYHIVIAFDSEQSTVDDRMKMYINGNLISSFDTKDTLGTQWYNMEGYNVSGKTHSIGRYDSGSGGGSSYYSGFMTELHFIDGFQLPASDFGYTDQLTGTWRPKKFKNSVASTAINHGATYSSNVSGTIYGGAATDIFDGNITDYASVNNTDSNNNSLTVSSLSVKASKVGVFVSNSASDIEVSVNGSVVGTVASGNMSNGENRHFTFTFTEATVTSVKARRVGSTSGWFIYGITLNDILLVDGLKDPNLYGMNGYHLPLDGSRPLGEDQSGNSNDWSLQNIRPSIAIDKATGALPILNTVCDGQTATVGVRSDTHSPGNLVLALPLAGITTDYSHLLNGGSTQKPLTLSGTAGSWHKTAFYSASTYFDGSDDGIRVGTHSDLNLGSGNFTIEGWFYDVEHSTTLQVFWASDEYKSSGTTKGFCFYVYDGKVRLYNRESGGFTQLSYDVAATAYLENTWNHWAWVRAGTGSNENHIYLNGIKVDSFTNACDYDDGQDFLVGGNDYSGSFPEYDFNGYANDVRVYKGYVKYTENFIPASPEPTITTDSPVGTIYPYDTDITVNGQECGSVSFDATDDDYQWSSTDFAYGSGTFTIECWFYVRQFHAQHMTIAGSYQDGSTQGNFIELYANGELYVHLVSPSNTHHDTGAKVGLRTWYHVALVREGTGSGEMHCYLNGKKTPNSMQENTNYSGARPFRVAALDGTATYDFDGFISNVRVLKGTALYTSDFTPPTEPLTNITNTVLLTCQSPLHIEHAVDPGSATVNGAPQASTFNPFKAKTNGRPGYYPRMNGIAPSSITNGSIRDGNYIVEGGNYNRWAADIYFGPGYIESGKYYWEITNKNGSTICYSGITSNLWQDSGEIALQNDKAWMGYFGVLPFTSTSYTSDSRITMYEGQTYGFALDLDNGELNFYRDGHLIHEDTTIPDPAVTKFQPFLHSTNDGASPIGSAWMDCEMNFGQRPYRFPPPHGYRSLNYANFRLSNRILRPDKYFGTVIYTGTGSKQTIRGLNFKPDMMIIKNRDTTDQWVLQDAVRGTWVNYPNTTDKGGSTGGGWIADYVQDGFTIDVNDPINTNTEKFVAYAWKAGGKKAAFNVDEVGYASMAAAGISDGDVSLTGISVNTRAGFSCGTWTGSGSGGTVATGLTHAKVVILKNYSEDSTNWVFYHDILDGSYDYMYFNLANDNSNSSLSHTLASTFKVGTNLDTNSTDDLFSFYAWEPVPGFSAFDFYKGDGSSTDGTFVHLGFKPSLIIIKNMSDSDSWCVYDAKRDVENPATTLLQMHDNAAETGYGAIDFLSDGFKIRSNVNALNVSGENYLYMAWASEGLNTLYGGASNAL